MLHTPPVFIMLSSHHFATCPKVGNLSTHIFGEDDCEAPTINLLIWKPLLFLTANSDARAATPHAVARLCAVAQLRIAAFGPRDRKHSPQFKA